MNEYTLLEMIGESPDEYVQEVSMDADLHGVNEDKAKWRKLQSTMILVALILTGVIVTGVYRATIRKVGMTGYESAGGADEVAPCPSRALAVLATETVSVYYVKDGGLQTKSVTLEMTSENIFEAWKEANGIGDEVKLLSCEVVSNGEENVSSNGNTSVAEYSAGDYFILNVTIGAGIREYFSDLSEALLKESLEKTFRDGYSIEFDEYHLTIK